MSRKSIAAAAFAVLVMFAGAGCSDQDSGDEPRAAGDSAADNAGDNAGEKGDAPKDDAADGGAEAPADGGDVDEFCEAVASQSKDGSSYNQFDQDLTDDEKAEWKENMADLVDVAPADIKPDIQVVTVGFAKVMDGEMDESDQEEAQELAASTQRMLDYMKTNCAGYDMELEGPGAS